MDIRADSQGRWIAIDMTAPTGPVAVTRLADRAEFTVKDKKYSVQLTANHLLYDNFGPAFESFMLKRYDLAKGGKQTFSRLVVPQAVLDFEVEYRGTEPRTVRGKELPFRRFDIRLLGLVVEIWADADFRIDMMRVPVQYAVFVRRGFEELMAETPVDPLLSRPEYKVSRRTVMVPMRDGVGLATDLYLPEAGGKRLPVILIRTPVQKGDAGTGRELFRPAGVCGGHPGLPRPVRLRGELGTVLQRAEGRIRHGRMAVGARLVNGQGGDDRRFVPRLGATLGGVRKAAALDDHHPQRGAARSLLQHPL